MRNWEEYIRSEEAAHDPDFVVPVQTCQKHGTFQNDYCPGCLKDELDEEARLVEEAREQGLLR